MYKIGDLYFIASCYKYFTSSCIKGFYRKTVDIKIGVLAYRSKDITNKQWDGFLKFLKKHLPLYHFELFPMALTEMNQAIKNKKIDFVITNPRYYVWLKKTFGLLNPLATMIEIENKKEITSFGGVKSGVHDTVFYKKMWSDLIEKGHWYGEIWNRRKNSKIYAEMLTISTIFDKKNIPKQFVAIFSDITFLKEHEKQLEHIAHHDALTNLPNRLLLSERLQQALIKAKRNRNLFAVLFLDLDDFKTINDRFGHETGDELLVETSLAIKKALRDDDTLARLGGDEFVIVLQNIVDVQMCVPMLGRLLEAVNKPILCGNLLLQVSASIGVTFYPQSETVEADQLLRQADQAMYQAKLSGKNRYHIFDEQEDKNVRGNYENIADIKMALENKEFVLYFQPKVEMRTGKIIGFEALIRWQHPTKGILPPAIFLPVIEEHELSIEIGKWVTRSVFAQARA